MAGSGRLSKARGGAGGGKLGPERMAGRFKSLPELHIAQGGDGGGLALIQSGQRRIDHIGRVHHDLAGEMFNRQAAQRPEIGARGARQHRLRPDMPLSAISWFSEAVKA